MSKNYTQLSPEQRYQIQALVQNGTMQKDIATIVGVHKSTICRELKRNIPKRGHGALQYSAKNAQRKTDLRHKQKPKRERFTEEMKEYARAKLADEKYSPELIVTSGKKEFDEFVSHETIYKWIWQRKFSNRRADRKDKHLYLFLIHGKRRRKRGRRKDSRGTIPNRVPIEKRPKIVNKRRRIGDYEVDLMMGKNHKGAVVVLTDRATLHTKLSLLKSKETNSVCNKIIARLKPLKSLIKTITFDNDQAFSKHERIAKKLEASTFFTRPYTSQDKGTVENRIGVLRRFIPKKTDLRKLSNKRIKEIEHLINNRPIRKFNYQTANQIFSKKVALIT